MKLNYEEHHPELAQAFKDANPELLNDSAVSSVTCSRALVKPRHYCGWKSCYSDEYTKVFRGFTDHQTDLRHGNAKTGPVVIVGLTAALMPWGCIQDFGKAWDGGLERYRGFLASKGLVLLVGGPERSWYHSEVGLYALTGSQYAHLVNVEYDVSGLTVNPPNTKLST